MQCYIWTSLVDYYFKDISTPTTPKRPNLVSLSKESLQELYFFSSEGHCYFFLSFRCIIIFFPNTPLWEFTCLSSLGRPCMLHAGGQRGTVPDLVFRGTPPLKTSPSKKVVFLLLRLSDYQQRRCHKCTSFQCYPSWM